MILRIIIQSTHAASIEHSLTNFSNERTTSIYEMEKLNLDLAGGKEAKEVSKNEIINL